MRWRKAASSITGVPCAAARVTLPVGAPGSLVTSRLVYRETLPATCSPASTARSSSRLRSTDVSPENATRMPCLSRPPRTYRPGFGYGDAGSRRFGRHVRHWYAPWPPGERVPPEPLAPPAAGCSDHSVSGWQASSGSLAPASAACARLGRKISASTRASSSASWALRWATPKCSARDASRALGRGSRSCRASAMVHSRRRTGAASPARAYSRAIIIQSKTALCATSTRPSSRAANSSAISGKSGASASISRVRPWIHTGPGSRWGLTSVYQLSWTVPRASRR